MRTYRQTELRKLRAPFRNFAKAPKTAWCMILLCALFIVTDVFTMEINRNAEESPLLFVFVVP